MYELKLKIYNEYVKLLRVKLKETGCRDMKKAGKLVIEAALLFLAVIFLVYGSFVKAVGSGTKFFIVWIIAAFVMACICACVHFGWFKKIPKPLKRTAAAIVCAGLAAFCIFVCCSVGHFDDDGGSGLDYIIVLGAQVYDDGPSVVLRYRLDKAAEYMEENSDTICIVSGGQGKNETRPEADVMAEYLEEKGISHERILKETESKTTKQNVLNSMKYIKEGSSAGIVTNNFHVMRALQIAEDAGLKDARGIAAGSSRMYLPNNILREFMAEGKYIVFH